MKKIIRILTTIIMVVFIALQSYGVTVSKTSYDISSLTKSNRDLKFNFELTNLNLNDEIEVTLFAGYNQLIIKQVISSFNDTAQGIGQNLVEGLNFLTLKDLNEGTRYTVSFKLNKVSTNFDLVTPGSAPLVGEDSFILEEGGVKIYWLYGNEFDNDRFLVIFDKNETFLNPNFTLDLSKVFMYDKSKPNMEYIPYSSIGKPGEIIYYKISAQVGGNSIVTATKHFTIPSKSTGVVNKILDSKIKIYPNPASNSLNVEVKDKSDLILYNLTGQQVYSTTLVVGINSLNINLENGLYIANINGKTASKILIKN